MKKNKILGASLLMASLLAISAGSFTSASSADFSFVETPVMEAAVRDAKVPDGVIVDAPTEELPSKMMAVSVNKSQVTSNSQSYQLEFSSKVDAYTSRYQFCYISMLNPPSQDEMKKLKETSHEDTEEDPIPVFEGAVYMIRNISTEKKKTDVVIPTRLRYADSFYIDVTTIYGNVIEANADEITSITIPATVTSIYQNAFEGITENCKVNVEADTRPEQYFDGFTPYESKVKYGYEITPKEQMQLEAAVYGGTFSFGSNHNYMTGYQDPDNENIFYPLVVRYDVYKDDALLEQRYQSFPISSKNSTYDGIGEGVGTISKTRYLDIKLAPGESVKDDSLVFFNIFEAEKVGMKWKPIISKMFYAHGRKGFAIKEHLEDYLSYSYESISTFAGYTTISMNVKFSDKNYKILKPSAYESNKASIESGLFYIRYRFTDLRNSIYCFEYVSDVDGSVKYLEKSYYTPVPQFVCETEDVATFMFKDSEIADDFSAENLKAFTIKGLTLSLDLFQRGGGKAATRSNLSSRFAEVPVVVNGTNVASTVTNVDSIFIWTAVIATVAYIILSTVYFFYAKTKYKNDEFRRVKPMKFLKTAIYGLLGSLLTIFTILFIVARTSWLRNTLVVFNPIDAFIIVFTILDLIVVGYGIKILVNTIKANREQKRNDKLKINEDVADDGTN